MRKWGRFLGLSGDSAVYFECQPRVDEIEISFARGGFLNHSLIMGMKRDARERAVSSFSGSFFLRFHVFDFVL